MDYISVLTLRLEHAQERESSNCLSQSSVA